MVGAPGARMELAGAETEKGITIGAEGVVCAEAGRACCPEEAHGVARWAVNRAYAALPGTATVVDNEGKAEEDRLANGAAGRGCALRFIVESSEAGGAADRAACSTRSQTRLAV